jgi:outer membrane protein assembly factor BamB
MTITSAALSLLLATSLSAGANWPEFRGPLANGHAESAALPLKWSETENVAWKTPIRGRAWSSPVVWDGLVWLTSASEDGRELYAVCVALDTGKVRHDLKLFDVAQPWEIHKFNSHASPTPVIEEGRVYLSWGSLGLACLDSSTAEVLWTRRDLECNHFRGPGSSPILFEDLLILPYDGYDFQYVVALDKRTGETVWRTDRPHNFETDNGDTKKAYGTPLVIEAAGRLQLICPASKGAFAYDPRTGQELWRVRYNGFSCAARPVFAHGLVYLSSGFSRSELLAVDPGGTGDVTGTHVRWMETKSMPSKPSPLVVGERVFLLHDQGVATCLNALTGEKVWQDRVGGNYSASPIYAAGRIYFLSEEGKTTVIEAADEYRVLAENQLDEGIMSSPAVAGDSLLIRTKTHLYQIAERAPAP